MKRLGFKKSVDLSGIDERVGTSESKIANLERTTSDTNKALATAQSELTAKFDNLAVGGRNYFRNSTPLRVIGGGDFQKNSENGVTFTANQATKTLFRLLNVIDSIGVWTVSCYAKATQNARLFVDVNDNGQVQDTGNQYWNEFNVGTEYQKIVATINTNKSSSVYNFVDFSTLSTETFTIKDLKIEKGSIATDWTPAPEDYTAGLAIYSTTTAQSPNVFVSDTGQLQRSTSSERYKEIISPLVLDDKAYKNAMKLNPIIYRSTAEADKQDWHYYSFLAEQLGKFDKAFTLWRTPTETIIDDNGEITITELEPIAEGINLNAIVAFLHATNVKQGLLIRDLTKRIEFLEKQRDK